MRNKDKKDKKRKNDKNTNQVSNVIDFTGGNVIDDMKNVRELTAADYGFTKSDIFGDDTDYSYQSDHMTIDDFNMNDEDEDEYVVTLPLEDGTELDCDVITLFELEGQDYVALYPCDGEPDEIYLFRTKYQLGSDNMELEEIDDEEEFKAVSDTFDEIMEQEEWNDLLGEDD